MTSATSARLVNSNIEALESLNQKTSFQSGVSECTEAKILSTISPLYSDDNSIDKVQKRMSDVVIGLFDKNEQSSESNLKLLYELQLIHLPEELILSILVQLPISDLLKMRLVCHPLQSLIEKKPELQAFISHHYLETIQSKCNIPMGDLKMDYSKGKLSLEVSNNLCLWKLTDKKLSIPQLYQAIPWASHLIIKNGKSEELLELFKQLNKSNNLTTLYLLHCEVDKDALNALKQLQTSSAQKTPYFYFCDLKTSNCELLTEYTSDSSHVYIIDPAKASEYSIERFVTQESDGIALYELSEQVENQTTTSTVILKNFESLNSVIKTAITASIWFSALMPIKNGPVSISDDTLLQVTSFVSTYPYHPVLSAALQKALRLYFHKSQ